MLTTVIETVGELMIVVGVAIAVAPIVGWGLALISAGVLLLVLSWLLVKLEGKP